MVKTTGTIFRSSIFDYFAYQLHGMQILVSGDKCSPSFEITLDADDTDRNVRWIEIILAKVIRNEEEVWVEIETSEDTVLTLFPEYTILLRQG